ncbi:RNA 2',3'-cyclic phosphodiesterase [Salibacterium halotolerans]|uniref:RNA 2',3'-cyclic phosphodiesterase n=1 Tax=Salibacterium halotolerans TaxID=1884432 RepID=A0A1I5R6H7_9BACI|nr:RNA 2',3'-cyclic phosphodiesterase [Salibacterium halotolerans]SFP53666.1 2'-5' RNA ligase [Salibacterium halotolerans]
MEPHYFTGLALPAEVKEKMAAWTREAAPSLSFKNWVHPEDYHITLFFLGAADTSTVQQTIELLHHSCAASSVFTMQAGGIGYFGPRKVPKVLWADTSCPEELQHLQQRVAGSCVSAGFTEEKRKYRPHITLARKWTETFSFSERFDYLPALETMEWTVKEAVLFRTHPHRTPKYERVETFPLAPGPG